MKSNEIKKYLIDKGANNYNVRVIINQILDKKNGLLYDITYNELDVLYENLKNDIHNNKKNNIKISNTIQKISKSLNIHPLTLEHLLPFIDIEPYKEIVGNREVNCIKTDDIVKLLNLLDEIKELGISPKIYITKHTNIVKYGKESYSLTDEGRKKIKEITSNNADERIKKAILTKRQKYNGKGNNSEKIKQSLNAITKEQRDEINEKTKDTIINKYGSLKNYYLHRVETFEQTYGIRTVFQRKDVIEKIKNTKNNKISQIENCYNVTLLSHLIDEYGQGWNRYMDDIEYVLINNNIYVNNSDIERIKQYNDFNKFATSSHTEKQIVDYIKSIYDGIIIENSRQIIKPKELDIYIPDKHLAIEYNGLKWHLDDEKGMLSKTELCESLNIRLLHIYEDEWMFKRDICKSIIKSALGITNKIYARNLTYTQNISKKDVLTFLSENHILGGLLNYLLACALIDENKNIMQLAIFGKSRYKTGEIELLRMVSKLNYTIVGGFSKLLKNQPYNNIVSYVDRRLYNGDGYIKCGFDFIQNTAPSYFYIVGKQRENRLKYQKHKLNKILKTYNPELSEKENMLINGYHRIYDSGTKKLIYKKK